MSITTALARNLNTLINQVKPRKASGYRVFDLTLARRQVVSPSLASLVFTGTDAQLIRTLAPDQRIKLFFPAPNGSRASLPHSTDWLATLRAMPVAQRPAMRTYTIRSVNPQAREVEVEFVLHGETGPASTWATHAEPGAPLQMVAPTAEFDGNPGGFEWQPPAGIKHVLLIGDETALPAIAGILEALARQPSPPSVEAFIEVPEEHDIRPLVQPAGANVQWLPRHAQATAHGEGMQRAARTLATLPRAHVGAAAAQPLKVVDIETQILWDLASPANSDFYAWVAGESAAVMAIRKHWISELGLDRRSLTLMGYWRLGRALD